MDNELALYHKILFLEFRPWTNRTTTQPKFKELLQNVKKEYFAFQPNYVLAFPKPLTEKRKYYYALIENEATRYLNNIHNIIAGALNDNEKMYWAHTTLAKKLLPKLKEISKIIDVHQYLFELLSSGNKSKTEIQQLDETYIIQLLKYQLIRIYIDLQESFKDFLKDGETTEEELHQICFSETAPVKSLLIPAEKIKTATPASKIIVKKADVVLNVLKDDFRKAKKGILDYKTIIKNDKRFASFEEQLFTIGYIDVDYNFNNKHGQIQELATIFHVLINKGYFSPKDFPNNKTLKLLDYRKFLDHRYNANTDKQFRLLGNEPQKVAIFLESNSWLDRLPPC